MNALPSASPRLDYLDALRGFAILGVISAHCAGQAGGAFQGCWLAFAGSTGVLLFFLVSASAAPFNARPEVEMPATVASRFTPLLLWIIAAICIPTRLSIIRRLLPTEFLSGRTFVLPTTAGRGRLIPTSRSKALMIGKFQP